MNPQEIIKMASSDISEKKSTAGPSANGDEEKLGTVTALDDLTVLGYTPELQRNRSMFTLLFQSLAIAAVSAQWLLACILVPELIQNGRSHMASEDP